MRKVILIICLTFSSYCLLAGDGQVFKVSLEIMQPKIHVGDRPLVLVKITNQSNRRMYLDGRYATEFSIGASITGESKLAGVIICYTGPPDPIKDAELARRREEEADSRRKHRLSIFTFAIDPGQTYMRVVEVNQIFNSGNTSIKAGAIFFATDDPRIPGKNWINYSPSVEKSITILKIGEE